MKDKKFLSDMFSIFLEILAWGLLIVVVALLLFRWLGLISSPEKMEIDLSINGIIFSWLFWLTREFWEFKSEVKFRLDLILSKLKLSKRKS
jgi:hypothetical protein